MCEWGSNYDEPCEVYNETERKARKHHTCESCSGPIVPGERYRYVSGVFDHSGFSFKQCGDCMAAHDEFAERHDEAPAVVDLFDALDHCVQEDGPSSWAVPFFERMKARLAAARRPVSEVSP